MILHFSLQRFHCKIFRSMSRWENQNREFGSSQCLWDRSLIPDWCHVRLERWKIIWCMDKILWWSRFTATRIETKFSLHLLFGRIKSWPLSLLQPKKSGYQPSDLSLSGFVNVEGWTISYILFCNWYIVSIVCTCQWPTQEAMLLCYFGHWAHFILAMYCYIFFLFFDWCIFCNIVNIIIFVNSAEE